MILVVALLVLGPKKLPEAARQLGKAMTEFRRVTAGLQDDVRGVLDQHVNDEPPAPVPVDHTVLTAPPIDPAPDTSDGDGAPADPPPAPPG